MALSLPSWWNVGCVIICGNNCAGITETILGGSYFVQLQKNPKIDFWPIIFVISVWGVLLGTNNNAGCT